MTIVTEPASDAALVARCRAGEDEAWRELVERFSRYVYAIAVQAFRLPEHDAEDVFQEVFARTYERLDEALDVHQALDRLSGDCREVLDRFFARDESYRTIGDALDIPPGTIASRISRCLEKLKAELVGRTAPVHASGKR